MKFDGERVVLDYDDIGDEMKILAAARGASEEDLRADVDHIIARHLARYYFAERLVAGREGSISILDAACGTGYGSYILAAGDARRSVVGIDLEADAVAYAREQFARPDLNITFQQADCTDLPWTEPTFDFITSFDTLEHLRHEDGIRFIERLAQLLRPGGLLILSTPSPREAMASLFHLHEYEADELQELLGQCFAHYRLFAQGFIQASAILPLEATSSAVSPVSSRRQLDMQAPLNPAPLVFPTPHGITPPPALRIHVAVCSHDPLPQEIAASIYCFDPPRLASAHDDVLGSGLSNLPT